MDLRVLGDMVERKVWVAGRVLVGVVEEIEVG